jgi:hypothetical protein
LVPTRKDKTINHIHDKLILHLSEVEDPHNNVEIHEEKNTIITNSQGNNDQPIDGHKFTSNETYIDNTITIPSRLLHDTIITNNKINFIKIKGKQEHSSINATTKAQEKYVLKRSTSKTSDALASQYNLIDQL